MEDNLPWKTTLKKDNIDGTDPLMKDYNQLNTAFEGQQPLEDYLQRKTILDGGKL